jgi:hypothetical protein
MSKKKRKARSYVLDDDLALQREARSKAARSSIVRQMHIEVERLEEAQALRAAQAKVANSLQPTLDYDVFDGSYAGDDDYFFGGDDYGEVNTRYAVSKSSVFTSNPLNSDANLRARVCEVCHSATRLAQASETWPSQNVDTLDESGDDAHFVLCENQKCKVGGGHNECLFPDGNVPISQWFCRNCSRNVKCSECDKLPGKETLVSCAYCEAVGHAGCMLPNNSGCLSVDSTWLCSFCICMGCEEGRANDEYVSCSICADRWHLTCWNARFPQQQVASENKLYCARCLNRKGKSSNKIEDSPSSNNVEEDETEDDGTDEIDSHQQEMWDQILAPPHSPAMNTADPDDVIDPRFDSYSKLVKTLDLIERDKPALYYVLRQEVVYQVPFDGKADWAEITKLLRSANPNLSDVRPCHPQASRGRDARSRRRTRVRVLLSTP